MKKWLLAIFVLFHHLAFGHTVYVVLSSDTSIWTNTSGGDDAYTYANEFDFDVFTNPAGVYHDVFEDSFRNAHTDSLGNPFKITWFMHGGGWFQEGRNTNAISTLFLIRKYWAPELQRWGDGLEYHFHHFVWNGAQWVMAPHFSDTIWDFDWTMSQMIVDESLYPVCFRSGWNYMDNEYQQYLERWIPFRMEGDAWMPDCSPYHPSYSDYRQPGTMKGWEVRHVYMKSFTNSFANNVFNIAHGGKEQVVCVWSHQNESDYPQQIESVDSALHTAAAAYPDVQFLYCTGKEAMQKWLHTSDVTPPVLNLTPDRQGDMITVLIDTEPDIYQIQPWVAARRYSGEYTRLDAEEIGSGQWRFSYSVAEIDRVVVAVSDIYGNTSCAEVQDGSRRWATQSEFYHSEPVNIDVESSIDRAVLAGSAATSTAVSQTNADSQTEVVRRSYWIGQTFKPLAAGISKVDFGADITQPTDFFVELRTLMPSGFPNDNPAGLLTTGTASLSASGIATAYLNYTGLELDGRSYALLFKIKNGSAKLWYNNQSVYADGILIRAFSLSWITIPNFDCFFRVYDGVQNLSIDQSLHNATAYNSERGYFVAQSFIANCSRIDGIEVDVTESLSNETIGVQLRTTLPNGWPDFSYDSMLYNDNIALAGAGIQTLPVTWLIPAEYQSTPLVLCFVAPQQSLSSFRLALDTHNPYLQGKMFVSDDLVSSAPQENSDLYMKIFTTETFYVSSGTLTMQHDAGGGVYWRSADIGAEAVPVGTSIRSRFRFGDTTADLNSAPWSIYHSSDHVSFPPQPSARLMQAQILLEATGESTPVLNSLEVLYEPPAQRQSTSWMFF